MSVDISVDDVMALVGLNDNGILGTGYGGKK
jgi:hypothetical protein